MQTGGSGLVEAVEPAPSGQADTFTNNVYTELLYTIRCKPFANPLGNPGAASLDFQSGSPGHVPHEILGYEVPSDGQYDVVVVHESGSVPDWIQLTVLGVGSIEHYTENGSITNPAESANPGMLAVGAAPWYDPHTIAPYSSRGPTPDGRVKPGIVGADCGETALAPLNEFGRGFLRDQPGGPPTWRAWRPWCGSGSPVIPRSRLPIT